MGDRGFEGALAFWRALALGSLALLLASMGERFAHRAPSTAVAAASAGASPALVAPQLPPQALPPEWRWRAHALPLERLYGATARD